MYDHLNIADLRAEIDKAGKIAYSAYSCGRRMKRELVKRIDKREEDFYEGDKVFYSNSMSEQPSRGRVISHDQDRGITKVSFIKKGIDELEVLSMYLNMRL
jgi:ribosomal protein L35AE/L33A